MDLEFGINNFNQFTDEAVREYGPLITSICRRLIQDPEIAEDAAQEVWVQIIKSSPVFKGESKLSTWIYTIAYRVAKDYSIREKTYSVRFLRDFFHRDGEPQFSGESQDPEKAFWVKEMCDRCLTGILHCLEPEEARKRYYKGKFVIGSGPQCE